MDHIRHAGKPAVTGSPIETQNAHTFHIHVSHAALGVRHARALLRAHARLPRAQVPSGGDGRSIVQAARVRLLFRAAHGLVASSCRQYRQAHCCLVSQLVQEVVHATNGS